MAALTFDQWWTELRAEAKKIDFPIAETDPDSYWGYYEDGTSVKDTLQEQVGYCD